ncbi:MAG: hypothetical protein NTX25_14905, partial [Proteobacteria bacterium]|nr:hypothetical protein [Pseudomonadota bacterium]
QELPYKGSHPLYSGKESYVIRIDLLKVLRGESGPWVAWARFLAPRLALHTVLLRHPRPRLIVCLQALAARMLRPCLDQILMLAMAKV